ARPVLRPKGGQISYLLRAEKGLLLGPDAENRVTLWEPATGRSIRRIVGDWGKPGGAAISEDGNLLALSCEGNYKPGTTFEDTLAGKAELLSSAHVVLVRLSDGVVLWRHDL